MSHKITIMRGLPYAGKTTMVHKYLADEDTKVISRKLIVQGFSSQYLTRNRVLASETILTKEMDEIYSAIYNGWKKVIVDANHLDDRVVYRLHELAVHWEYEFKVIDLDTSLQECLKRRSKLVGQQQVMDKDTLINLAFKYKRAEQKIPFVIFELEDVIADQEERFCNAVQNSQYYNTCVEEDFYDPTNLTLDKVSIPGYKALMYDFHKGFEIIILTRRPVSLKDETEIWLNSNKIPYHRLIMMPNINDSEFLFKKNAVNQYIDLKYCCGIYDNNEKFINYMKSQDVRTTQIESEALAPVS